MPALLIRGTSYQYNVDISSIIDSNIHIQMSLEILNHSGHSYPKGVELDAYYTWMYL